MSKRLAFVVIALIGVALPQFALAACGYAGVSVSGTAEEVEDACRALDEVLAYFKKIGLQSDPEISISFQDRVYVDMYLQAYGPKGREPVGRNEVSGFYDSRRKELQIASARREIKRERRPWRIEWGQSIAYSILQHELVHAIVADRLGNEYQSSESSGTNLSPMPSSSISWIVSSREQFSPTIPMLNLSPSRRASTR